MANATVVNLDGDVIRSGKVPVDKRKIWIEAQVWATLTQNLHKITVGQRHRCEQN